MPLVEDRSSDPTIMRRYGFVVDGQTAAEPRRTAGRLREALRPQLNEEMLDITCAACHTGQINVTRNGRTTALRIDGGSALHAFTNANIGHFVPTLLASMLGTLVNPMKFNRFANAVLGPNHDGGRWALRAADAATWPGSSARWRYNEKAHGLVPTEEGYGRTDALARIANTVFGDHIEASNYAVGNAPVNYPPVWNIWKFDWVQYNASVSQPMARNIGESMGTGAKYALVDRYGKPLPPDQRFRSTAHAREPAHDRADAAEAAAAGLERGRARADRSRQGRARQGAVQPALRRCHGPYIAPPAIKARNAPLKRPSEPEWIVKTLCIDDIGTDPNTRAELLRRPRRHDQDRADGRRPASSVARKELDLRRQREARRLEARDRAPARRRPGSDAADRRLQKQLAGSRRRRSRTAALGDRSGAACRSAPA